MYHHRTRTGRAVPPASRGRTPLLMLLRLCLAGVLGLALFPAASPAQAPDQEFAAWTSPADETNLAAPMLPEGALVIDQYGQVLLWQVEGGCASAGASTGTDVGFVAAERSRETEFCWSNSRGRGVGTIPDACGPGQERNGLLCYERCQTGYASDGVAGCIQRCPEGAQDDGLFCGWPSYKAAEYPIWDEQRCRHNHGTGCSRIGALWVENCRSGYRHVAGFCERENIDCAAMGLAGSRIANTCAKRIYQRPPHTAGCGTKEYDAGLCYEPCRSGERGVGPVCWAQGPPGWVQCGGGWAKDHAACRRHITDQVVSVLETAVNVVVLVGTAGASQASQAGNSTTLWNKDAWTNVKSIGKDAVKDVLTTSVAPGTAAGAPGAIAGWVNFYWDLGEIQEDSVMTQTEKDHAITQLVFSNLGALDPVGVTKILAAYTKPLCADIAANRSGPSAPAPPTVKSDSSSR